jgi:DNA-binding NarL/FixJ family response regulator
MRIVIAEDEALLREGLTMVLERRGLTVAAAVSTAVELREAVESTNPDFVITDIRMPPTFTDEGLQAALAIRQDHPQLPLMVLSQYVQRRPALALIEGAAAGTGYLLKQRVTDSAAFCADIEAIGDGATILDPEVAALMVARARSGPGAVDALTARQREVLSLMAQGRSNAWIARSLTVSEKAVVQHVSHIYTALDLPQDADDHRRVLAVIRYLAR